MKSLPALLILTLLLAAACSRPSSPDGRLARIADFVSDEPRRAADSLRCVDPSALSAADRALFGLLSVKAADKAFVRHTSDSLILSVIGHYQSSPPSSPLLLPEALYYGGRVTSDLGDYPRALRYFHDALSALPSDDTSRPALDLRARILGQTAYLLRSLRLYSQSMPYIHESIRIDHILSDSLALTEDLKLLALVNTWTRRYPQADSAFSQAFEASRSLPDADRASVLGEWALLKRAELKPDSALRLISSVPRRVEPAYRSYYALAAADIFLDLQHLDSAYTYARSVIDSESDPVLRSSAYRILLDPALRGFLPAESLTVYVDSLRSGLIAKAERYDAESTIFQNSVYNYSAFERSNIELIRRQSGLVVIVAIAVCLILLLALGLVYSRFLNARRINTLRTQVNRLKALNRQLSPDSAEKTESLSESLFDPDSVSSLRSEISSEIAALSSSAPASPGIPESVTASPVYSRLLDLIAQNHSLSASDPLWIQTEQLVCAMSPNFRLRLSLLAGTVLSDDDVRLALLIRIGMTPSQTSTLMGRSRSTISYRRRQLCSRAFRGELPYDRLDDLIRRL